MSTKPAFPVPKGRSFGFPMNLFAEGDVPEGRAVFSVQISGRGVPSVVSAVLKFQWSAELVVLPLQPKVFDDGIVVVDCDSAGRVCSVEATAFVGGPMRIPELVEEHTRLLREGGASLLMTAAQTIFVYWKKIDLDFKRIAKQQPHPLARGDASLAMQPRVFAPGYKPLKTLKSGQVAWVGTG